MCYSNGKQYKLQNRIYSLQQLKYVVTVAEKGTLSEAAKELFVSQPALTKAIKELEDEMNIRIFSRTNKGVIVSREGDRFLGYARQVLEQTNLLEEEYKKRNKITRRFSVSTQHYSFAMNAFVDMIKKFGDDLIYIYKSVLFITLFFMKIC